jgi:putative ABC transport system ATP-binding protein
LTRSRPAPDRESGRAVVGVQRRLADHRATTTLLITHDSRILEVADRIAALEDRRITSA